MKLNITKWLNKPVNFPNWLGYFLIAILACFLNTFILTNMFKSVGIQQQFIEARSQINDLESEQHSHSKNRFILF